MKAEQILSKLVREILMEADKNPSFAARLNLALGIESDLGAGSTSQTKPDDPQRPRNRRPAAALDPVSLADEGELALRQALSVLSIEQLKDVIAEFGMDPDRLALKWKSKDRLVDRIVEVSMSRSKKGNAFMSK